MNNKYSGAAVGAALVALSALGYSTNPIFGKMAYSAGANAVSLLAIRFTMAAIGMWVLLAARGEAGALDKQKRWQLLALGALGQATVSLLYFVALEHIGASLATGIFYTYPAFVAVAGLFRGEGLSRLGAAGLLLTVAGTWLLLSNDLGGFTWGGAALILCASLLYTLYILVSNAWTRGTPPTVSATYVTTGAALVYLLIAAVTQPPLPGAGAYLAGAGLALCSTILAMITFFAGLPRVGSTRAAIISTLEPVFTALLAVVALHEHLGVLQTLGTALVVAGAVAAQQKEPAAETAD
ncbi:MAG: multidrug transporter permease [Symbiobacteriaceae bacterium]|jgi:drug/metabolite transporter (DMT)-like permease|nr:multidrug transporter permease [Symbiobacteriaceae bacterium]